MAGTKEGSRVQGESSCRELLGGLICRRNECACFPVCLCVPWVRLCMFGALAHVSLCAHCECWELEASICRVIPRRLNLRAERTSFFHLAQMSVRRLNHLRPIWTPPLTLQVNIILQGVFNGQWRVPMRLRKPLIQMFSRCQQQFFRRQMQLVIQRCVKLVQSLTRT